MSAPLAVKLSRLAGGKYQLKLRLEAGPEAVERWESAAIVRAGRGVSLPGFRAGHAPAGHLRRLLPVSAWWQDFIKPAGDRLLRAAADQAGRRAWGEPKIDILDYRPGRVLIAELEQPVVGEIKLPAYQSWRQPSPSPPKIDKAIIDAALFRLRLMRAQFAATTGPARQNDRLTADIYLTDPAKSGSQKGAPLPGSQAADQVFQTGAGDLLPEFERQLIGLTSGQQAVIDFKSLGAGTARALRAHLSIKKIERPAVPPLDAGFAAGLGHADVLGLRRAIKTQLSARARHETAAVYSQQLLERLINESRIDLPASLIEQEVAARLAAVRQQTERAGTDWNDFLASRQLDETAYRQQLEGQANRALTASFVIDEVAHLESLVVLPDNISQDDTSHAARRQRLTAAVADRLAKIAAGGLEPDAPANATDTGPV